MSTPWWRPDVHAERRHFLEARRRIIAAIRTYFADREFIEVECAALQHSPGNEAHLHALATEFVTTDGEATKLYLHTSPEFSCKKLLAAGERRIFDLARVFRNREQGSLHAPEFTMLEWYRADESYGLVMEDCVAILRCAMETLGGKTLHYRGRAADPFLPAENLTVAAAFERHARIDLLATLDPNGMPDAIALRSAAERAGHHLSGNDNWSDMFSKILVASVEPNLGSPRVTILREYPVTEAALARRTTHDPRVAERFELYACGVELANGFGELRDPQEQRRRFEAEMDEKYRIYGERYPIDEDLLAALPLMPEASGVALGLDRLIMLATGASRIEQVQWTPLR